MSDQEQERIEEMVRSMRWYQLKYYIVGHARFYVIVWPVLAILADSDALKDALTAHADELVDQRFPDQQYLFMSLSILSDDEARIASTNHVRMDATP